MKLRGKTEPGGDLAQAPVGIMQEPPGAFQAEPIQIIPGVQTGLPPDQQIEMIAGIAAGRSGLFNRKKRSAEFFLFGVETFQDAGSGMLTAENRSITGEDILIDNGEMLKSNFIW